jgi:hypothetical protein
VTLDHEERDSTAAAGEGDDRSGADAVEAETPTVGRQELTAWLDRRVFDVDRESIGRLAEVYFDIESGEPQFGIVAQGSLIHHRRFVPLVGAVVGPESIQVAVSGDQVKGAPSRDIDEGQLTADDESALYHYYHLNYEPTDRESGRRLVRH